jgi:hypothetical protein
LIRAFAELIDEQRDLESFMMLGDITAQESLQSDPAAHHALEQISVLLDADSDALHDHFIVIDRSVLISNDLSLVEHIR